MKNKKEVKERKELKLFVGIFFLILMIGIFVLGVRALGTETELGSITDIKSYNTATDFLKVVNGQGETNPIIVQSKKDIAIDAWKAGIIIDKTRIWNSGEIIQKEQIFRVLPPEEIEKFFRESEGKKDSSGNSVQGSILESAYKDQFGKDLDVVNLPSGVELKIEKNKAGKTTSIKLQFTKDGKANGEVTITKSMNRISSDIGRVTYTPASDGTMKSTIIPPKGNLLISRSGENGKIQTFDISQGLSLNENLEFSYEGMPKDSKIKAGYGSVDGYMNFDLKQSSSGNTLLVTIGAGSSIKEINSFDDVKTNIANTPSLLMGNEKTGYFFAQPQGDDGVAGFQIDNTGKMTVIDNRVRFVVASDNYNIDDKKTHFSPYSVSAGVGTSFVLDRTAAIDPNYYTPSNEIRIGKNNVITMDNKDKDDIILYDMTNKFTSSDVRISGNGPIKYYNSLGALQVSTQNSEVSTTRTNPDSTSSALSSNGNQRVGTNPSLLPGPPLPDPSDSSPQKKVIDQLVPPSTDCSDGECSTNNVGVDSNSCSDGNCGSTSSSRFRIFSRIFRRR